MSSNPGPACAAFALAQVAAAATVRGCHKHNPMFVSGLAIWLIVIRD